MTPRFAITKADGTTIVGVVQGAGGPICSLRALEAEAWKATNGYPLGAFEPKRGCVAVFESFGAVDNGPQTIVSLVGAEVKAAPPDQVATVRAICVRDPWVSLIERGLKTIEVRSWRTHHRGELLLVSSARQAAASSLPEGVARVAEPELGVTRVLVDLVDVRPMTEEDSRAAMVPFVDGAFAWILGNPRSVPRTATKGQLGFFQVSRSVLEKAHGRAFLIAPVWRNV